MPWKRNLFLLAVIGLVTVIVHYCTLFRWPFLWMATVCSPLQAHFSRREDSRNSKIWEERSE